MKPVTLLLASAAIGLLACTSEPTSPEASRKAPVAEAQLASVGPYYAITYLSGTTPGTAYGINNNGQAAGLFSTSNGFHAFLWTNGVKQDLGTAGGQAGSVSLANAVNAAGQVVGKSSNPAGQLNAALWQNGAWRDLGTLAGPGFNVGSVANAINATGLIVGWSYTATLGQRAFLWQNGTMSRLAGLNKTYGAAFGVNNTGVVVGEFQTTSGTYHAFRWKDGVVSDLGTLGGIGNSSATAINNNNQVVGWSTIASGAYHAFIWQGGVTTDLGTLGGTNSAAIAVNGLGQVVGWSDVAVGSPLHAFIWDNGVMTDLGPGDARGINRDGWVVGTRGDWRVTFQGALPTLWKPSPTPPPASKSGSIGVANVVFFSDRNGSYNSVVDTVAVGQTVTWHWISGTHSVHSQGSPGFTSSAVMSGAGITYSKRFATPGIYRFNCQIHPTKMTGRIVVK